MSIFLPPYALSIKPLSAFERQPPFYGGDRPLFVLNADCYNDNMAKRHFSYSGLWIVLFVIYLLLAFVFSIIQPLGRTPDEAAHVQYVKFLAEQRRLPFFEPQGGGEGGYEAQHPPLYYAVMAIVYAAAQPFAERWRWHILRWATIALVGIPMYFISRHFFLQLYPQQSVLAFWGTATVMLMPLTLLYSAYVNPDGMAMLWASGALSIAVQLLPHSRGGGAHARFSREPQQNPRTAHSCPQQKAACSASCPSNGASAAAKSYLAKQALVLGLLSGAALLTKLSAAPVLIVALAAYVWRDKTGHLRCHIFPALLTAFIALLIGGWWYARNAYFYGTPFIHTEGKMGSGLQFGFWAGFDRAAWLTIRETYLSSWIQRGWIPPGAWSLVLYGLIMLMTLLAALGLIKAAWRRASRRAENKSVSNIDPKTEEEGEAALSSRLRRALNLAGLLLVLIVLGHQWAYWTMDVEFNAGGRYVLVAMLAVALLLVEGARQALGRYALFFLGLWIIALLTMNQISIWHIWTILNPRYAPGWQLFHFP